MELGKDQSIDIDFINHDTSVYINLYT